MKVLRMVLITVVAPATILLGLTKLGDTPISRGYNVGFLPRVEQDSSGVRLATATDVGDLTCWLELKVPAASPSFTAKVSTDTELSVYRESVDGSYQWIAVVAEGHRPPTALARGGETHSYRGQVSHNRRRSLIAGDSLRCSR
jgi:hypothetical protein